MQLKIPAIKAHVAWHRLGEEQIVLRVGDSNAMITGRIYADLLEAIDGATTDEIVAESISNDVSDRDRAFMEFVRGVIRIRKRYKLLHSTRFLHGGVPVHIQVHGRGYKNRAPCR